MQKQLSTVLLATATSILLGFIGRLNDGFSVPLLILRLTVSISLIGLAIAPSKDRQLYLALNVGILTGTLLAYWDELSVMWKYQFSETFLIPIILVTLLVCVGATWRIGRAK